MASSSSDHSSVARWVRRWVRQDAPPARHAGRAPHIGASRPASCPRRQPPSFHIADVPAIPSNPTGWRVTPTERFRTSATPMRPSTTAASAACASTPTSATSAPARLCCASTGRRMHSPATARCSRKSSQATRPSKTAPPDNAYFTYAPTHVKVRERCAARAILVHQRPDDCAGQQPLVCRQSLAPFATIADVDLTARPLSLHLSRAETGDGGCSEQGLDRRLRRRRLARSFGRVRSSIRTVPAARVLLHHGDRQSVTIWRSSRPSAGWLRGRRGRCP